jgi:hypothetical protein
MLQCVMILAVGSTLLAVGALALVRARTATRELFRNFTSTRQDIAELRGLMTRFSDRLGDVRAATAMTQAALWAGSQAEFLTPFDWSAAVERAARRQPKPIPAESFLRRRQTGAHPVDLRCADGNIYVVKGVPRNDDHKRLRLFTEQVVGLLGRLIEAPIPEVAVISIGADLIQNHPDVQEGMGHLWPGAAHGSRYLDGLGDGRCEIMHVDENRKRFAKLAILQAWTNGRDMQFIYENNPPHRVYSTDHGCYFTDDPSFSKGDVRLAALAYPGTDIIDTCRFSFEELAAAAEPLRSVTAQQITDILAIPPASWGIDLDQRATIGHFLRLRQFQLLAMFGALKAN